MNTRFFSIILVLFLFSFGCGQKNTQDITSPLQPEDFLKAIHTNNRFVDSDEIAKKMINQDPILQLIDVRSPQEFAAYHLPGAINIPFENVLDEKWTSTLNQDILELVFYSNDDVFAEQAWAICKQKGYSNLYVLDGGLNRWFETIMLPPEPSETDPIEDFELYQFRVGASIYFGSGSVNTFEEPVTPRKVKNTVPIQKKVKREAEGGC